jgi:hypothetical protein
VCVLNVLLRGQLQTWISQEKGVMLTLEGAWSPWFGYVRAKRMSLDYEDQSIVLRLRLDDLRTQVSLLPLARRYFKASNVVAKNAQIHLWPKDQLTSPPNQSVPEAGDWSVEIDAKNVTGGSLRVHRYRYMGKMEIEGGFTMIPKFELEVRPTVVHLKSGALFDDGTNWCTSYCQARAAGDVTLSVRTEAPRHRLFQGKYVVNQLERTSLSGRARFENLDFIAEAVPSMKLNGGAGDLEAELGLHQGALTSSTRLDYAMREPLTTGLVVRQLGVTGGLQHALLQARIEPRSDTDSTASLRVNADLTGASAETVDGTVARIESLRGWAQSRTVVLADLLEIESAALDVAGAELSDMEGLTSVLRARNIHTRATGELQGSLALAWQREQGYQGEFHAKAHPLRLALPIDPPAALAFGGEVGFSFEANSDISAGKIRDATLKVTSATVNRGEERATDFWARVDVPSATWQAGSARAKVFARLSDADLPLILLGVKKDIPGIVDALFSMSDLKLVIDAAVVDSDMGIQVERGDSDGVDVKGAYVKGIQSTQGAFLADLGVMKIGIALDNGKTRVTPFAGTDWLARNTPCAHGVPGKHAKLPFCH